LRIGIEIGGTKLQAAIGTAEGDIVHLVRAESPAQEGAPAVRRRAANLVKEVCAETPEPLEQVGIGFGGPVVRDTGCVIKSHQVGGWEGFGLREWAGKAFGLPAVVENDSNAAAVAEARRGAGRGRRRVFYMNVGSGIGGGLVLDGRLVTGPRFGGEIGHTHVWDAEAGRYDILESLCSGWSIARRARRCLADHPDSRILALAEGDPERVDAAVVGAALAEGDPLAVALMDEVCEALAVALANVAALVEPDVIAIGGGVALMGEPLFQRLGRAFDRRAFAPLAGRCPIVPAALGEESVVVGALLLEAGDVGE